MSINKIQYKFNIEFKLNSVDARLNDWKWYGAFGVRLLVKSFGLCLYVYRIVCVRSMSRISINKCGWFFCFVLSVWFFFALSPHSFLHIELFSQHNVLRKMPPCLFLLLTLPSRLGIESVNIVFCFHLFSLVALSNCSFLFRHKIPNREKRNIWEKMKQHKTNNQIQ